MPTKSNNTQGNPYHDEEGKFTSSDDSGVKKLETNAGTPEVKKPAPSIKLKEGVDFSDLLGLSLRQLGSRKKPVLGVLDTKTPVVMPTSIENAMMQGNRILGSNNIVGYAADTDLSVAKDYNMALIDVVADFPELFTNNQLINYGTKINNKSSNGQTMVNVMNIVKNVISKPEYINQMKNLGLTEEQVINQTSLFVYFGNDNIEGKMKDTIGGITSMGSFNPKNELINVSNSILLNPDHSKDMQRWRDYYYFPVQFGDFLKPGLKSYAYSTAAHELGHHIFAKIKNFANNEELKELENAFTNDLGYDAFKPIPFIKSSGEQGYMNAYRRKLSKPNVMSGYACESAHEHAAEAVSNWYCRKDKATLHNQRIFKLFKKIYDRVYSKQ